MPYVARKATLPRRADGTSPDCGAQPFAYRFRITNFSGAKRGVSTRTRLPGETWEVFVFLTTYVAHSFSQLVQVRVLRDAHLSLTGPPSSWSLNNLSSPMARTLRKGTKGNGLSVKLPHS